MAVHDRDLTMVAQISPCVAAQPKGEHAVDCNPAAGEGLDHRADPGPRTSRIEQYAARDASLRGAGEGCHDLLTALVIRKDEVEQVNMVLRAIDLGHERIDAGVVGEQDGDAVAGYRRKVAQVLDKGDGLLEALWNMGAHRSVLSSVLRT